MGGAGMKAQDLVAKPNVLAVRLDVRGQIMHRDAAGDGGSDMREFVLTNMVALTRITCADARGSFAIGTVITMFNREEGAAIGVLYKNGSSIAKSITRTLRRIMYPERET